MTQLSSQRTRLQNAREWAGFTLVIGSRVYRAMLLTLVAIALAPLLLSWHAYVIKSASMEPSIDVGDVALARPFTTDEEVDVGRVYMFRDPASDTERILVHRIVEFRNDGTWTTQGDANATPDSTPIVAEDITGRGILLVPYVGLPIVWLQSGQWLHLGLWLMLTMGAFFLATRNVEGEPPKWTLRRLVRDRLRRTPEPENRPDDRVLTRRTGRLRTILGGRGVRAVVATLTLSVAGATALGSANAAFTASTQHLGNTFTAGSWMLPYVAAVTADGPRGFWLLDETGGTAVRDHSRTYAADGSTSGTVRRGLPGAHTARNPGTSFGFDGGSGRLNPSTMTVGTRHTVELWFRTTSKQEGYLIGFEDPNDVPAWNYDRTVLMTDGKIVVGNWTLFGRDTITTPLSYNDGKWHHLAVTMVPGSGIRGPTGTIFVDGAQVVQGETSSVSTSFRGHWQLGKGSRAGGSIFTPFPVEVTFRGDIDAVSIFDKALTPARVKAHYDAR